MHFVLFFLLSFNITSRKCKKVLVLMSSMTKPVKNAPLGIPKEVICLLSAAQSAKTYAGYKEAFQKLQDLNIGCNDAQLSTLVFLVAFARVLFSSDLKANSANCRFTYMKASLLDNPRSQVPLFIKFALPDPYADAPLNDTVYGYMLTWLKQREPRLQCVMTYIDCFATHVTDKNKKWIPTSMLEARDKTQKQVCRHSSPAKQVEGLVSCSAFVAVKGKALKTIAKDPTISTTLKSLPEFLGAFAYLGINLGFIHNDCHFGNILYGVNGNSTGPKRLILIDYGRVSFDQELLKKYGALQTLFERIPIDVTKLCMPSPPNYDLTRMSFDRFMTFSDSANITASKARVDLDDNYRYDHEFDDDFDINSAKNEKIKKLVVSHLYLCDLACMGGNFANLKNPRISYLYNDLVSYENYGRDSYKVEKAASYMGASIFRKHWNQEMPPMERALLCCAFAAWLLLTVQAKYSNEVDLEELEDAYRFWNGGKQFKYVDQDDGFFLRFRDALQENLDIVNAIDKWLLERFEAIPVTSHTVSNASTGGDGARCATALPSMFHGNASSEFEAYIQKHYPVEVAPDDMLSSGPPKHKAKKSKPSKSKPSKSKPK